MKRLIVCTDGTWNSRDAKKVAGGGVTNVVKLHDVIAERDRSGVPQVPMYLEGVGTGPWWDRIVGGAFGKGVSENIQRCYAWIVEEYEPGDELFFFGFSRGAFTARSLVGFIRNCGILRREHKHRIQEAYEFYRSRDPAKHPRTQVSQIFRDNYAHGGVPAIKCVGVWDTVGSLGVPTTGPIGWYTRRRYGFHDVALSSWVQNAFHALAIDERRKPFKPTLWEVADADAQSAGRTRRIEQVWFAGVHSNVGGGYPNAKLSDLALRWILDRARECGLALTPPAERYVGDCLGEMWNSMTVFYRPFGPHARPVLQPRSDPAGRPVHTFESVSPSVFERRRTHRPPAHSPEYAPANLAHIREALEQPTAIR